MDRGGPRAVARTTRREGEPEVWDEYLDQALQPEVETVKRTIELAAVVVMILLSAGCAGSTTTTTTTITGSAATSATAATSTTSASTSTTIPTTTTVTVSFDNASIFVAELSGAEVVPPVETLATGSAIFKIDPTGTRAYFKLTLSNVTDVIASRVHEGKTGTNGQGLLILYPGPTLSGPYNGALAQGYFDASVLIGSLTGRSLAEFAALLEGGYAYVNVGTIENPDGEVRGQIREQTSPSGGQTE